MQNQKATEVSKDVKATELAAGTATESVEEQISEPSQQEEGYSSTVQTDEPSCDSSAMEDSINQGGCV